MRMRKHTSWWASHQQTVKLPAILQQRRLYSSLLLQECRVLPSVPTLGTIQSLCGPDKKKKPPIRINTMLKVDLENKFNLTRLHLQWTDGWNGLALCFLKLDVLWHGQVLVELWNGVCSHIVSHLFSGLDGFFHQPLNRHQNTDSKSASAGFDVTYVCNMNCCNHARLTTGTCTTGKMCIKSRPCIWWGSIWCGHFILGRTATIFSVRALKWKDTIAHKMSPGQTSQEQRLTKCFIFSSFSYWGAHIFCPMVEFSWNRRSTSTS